MTLLTHHLQSGKSRSHCLRGKLQDTITCFKMINLYSKTWPTKCSCRNVLVCKIMVSKLHLDLRHVRQTYHSSCCASGGSEVSNMEALRRWFKSSVLTPHFVVTLRVWQVGKSGAGLCTHECSTHFVCGKVSFIDRGSSVCLSVGRWEQT